MKPENTLKIVLGSSTPFIAEYDKKYSTNLGIFFDEMAKNNMTCWLNGPSENELLFGIEECFGISTDASFKTDITSYSGHYARGKSILNVLRKFITHLEKSRKEKQYLCRYSISTDILFQTVKNPKTKHLKLKRVEAELL